LPHCTARRICRPRGNSGPAPKFTRCPPHPARTQNRPRSSDGNQPRAGANTMERATIPTNTSRAASRSRSSADHAAACKRQWHPAEHAWRWYGHINGVARFLTLPAPARHLSRSKGIFRQRRECAILRSKPSSWSARRPWHSISRARADRADRATRAAAASMPPKKQAMPAAPATPIRAIRNKKTKKKKKQKKKKKKKQKKKKKKKKKSNPAFLWLMLSHL